MNLQGEAADSVVPPAARPDVFEYDPLQGRARRQAFEQTLTIESLMHRVTFASEDVLARVEEAS